MNMYDKGYNQGYEDAQAGDDDTYSFLNSLGELVMDTIAPPLKSDPDWKQGYIDGWEAGN